MRDHAGRLLRFYTTARDITERIELARQLELAAVTDDLTGLLNRRGFLLIARQELRVAVDAVLDRLQSAIATAPPLGPYPLSVSLGVALFRWGDAISLDDLIAVADQRMYENKRIRRASDGKALVRR